MYNSIIKSCYFKKYRGGVIFMYYDHLYIVPTDEKDSEGYQVEITLATLGDIGCISYNEKLDDCMKDALPVCTCFLKNETLKSAIKKLMVEKNIEYIYVSNNMSRFVYDVEKMKHYKHWKENGNHGIQILSDCP